MNPVAILTDSTCDLTKEQREQYGIDYAKMNYVVDEREYPAGLDWEAHSAREFYDLMRGGKRIRTAQVSQETFEEVFSDYLSRGFDVVYVACSSALSGSVRLAQQMQPSLSERFPNVRLYCVDSLISSLGQGWLAMKAAMLRDEGKSAEQIATWLEENRLKVNQIGTTADLEYLRRAGRVKASSAFFGNLFGIKPMLISDRIGQNYAVKKVKGTVAARQEMANIIAECVIAPETQTLYISHADDLPAAEALRDAILARVPFADVTMGYIGPIVGASVGPGTVIAFCFGQEVTIEGKE